MNRSKLILVAALSSCTLEYGGDDGFSGGATLGAGTQTSEGSESGAGTSTGPADATSADTTSGDTGMTILDVSAPETTGTISEIAEVFGHSADTLYRLDPETKEVEEIGTFDGCTASIIDIALDADSRMFGAAYGSLWSIDRTSGACTLIADGDYPTSLSFVPAGTVDPDREALVGFVDDEYIRIDTETGEITPLGTLTGGLASSGDMVSVANGGSYLTVYDDGACNDVDCIVEIDPRDGTVLVDYGPLPYGQVFGLAFWAGRAYGFARGGELFEIDFDGGEATTTPIPIPGAPAMLEFFGAGSTTSAPPVEG
ncbi:MAG: hypothetical protein IAG13_16105 [Deltaproteobacteria bacterium]|nr:hypothetical protein [Nannocystaceae bacterium]